MLLEVQALKKSICLLLCGLLFLLTGCSSFSFQGINDLLRAPALGQDEGQVQEALVRYLGEAPEYKYPKEGDLRSPLTYADLDGDGTEEAIILFSLSASSAIAHSSNTSVAILRREADEWNVVDVEDGVASEVTAFEVADLLHDNTFQLIVGYATANLTTKTFVLYQYKDGGLSMTIKTPYSGYKLDDFTGDGSIELVIVSSEDTVGGLKLQYIPAVDGKFDQTGQDAVLLNKNFTSCDGIYPSNGPEGARLLVLDGVTGTDMLASQIVYYSGDRFYVAQDETESIAGESGRVNALLKSRDINGDGVVETPVRLGKNAIETVGEDKRLEYVQWLNLTAPATDEERKRVQYGIVDTDRGAYIRLPESWIPEGGDATIEVVDGAETGEWTIENAETGQLLLLLRIFGQGQEPPEDAVLVSRTSNAWLVFPANVSTYERNSIKVTELN